MDFIQSIKLINKCCIFTILYFIQIKYGVDTEIIIEDNDVF